MEGPGAFLGTHRSMEEQAARMARVKCSYTIKPAEPTPIVRLWLHESDQFHALTHAPTIYFYRPVHDISLPSAVETMKKALSQALVPFYPLAGRLYMIDGGRVELHCNQMGARILEAESETKIDDFGDFRPTPEIRELVPRIDYSKPINELPLLLVQLTKFQCGGISVGMAISHIVADGLAALHFISSWAKFARGEQLEIAPFHDRTVGYMGDPLATPRFDHVEFSPPPLLIGRSDTEEERRKETTVAMVKLTKDQVEKLKQKTNEGRKEHDGRGYSRYEAMAAHMWRCACKARKHDIEQLTTIRVAVDFRNRLRPALPPGYFGNATLVTTPTARSGDLVSKSLGYAASKIREAVGLMNDEYVKSATDFLKSQPDMTRFRTSFHTVGCPQGDFLGNPNLAVTSWLGLPIYDADFGWGKPIHMGPASLGFDGKSFIIPGPDEDGSFIIALRLQITHMDDFKKYFFQDI